MAKYGKNNYFDGVILPEPKEEMLRRMAKGVNCPEGYLRSTNAGLLFDGPRTLEVFFNYQRTAAYQRPAGFTADTIEFEISASNDTLVFYCGRGRTQASLVDGQNYHAAISYNGDTATAYLNGDVVGTITPANYIAPALFNIGSNIYPPKGSIYFSRVYNYAVSGKENKTLYNNGDPAGYVMPANYKGYGDVYHSDFSEGADGWHVVLADYVTMTAAGGVITISKDDANRNMNIARIHNPYDSRVVDYFVRLEFAEPLPSEVANIVARPFNTIAGINLTISSDRLSASGTFINSGAKPNGGSMIIFQGSGAVSVSVSSISFTPAVCVAEYLPHNLIPTAEGSVVKWLDSAPQLPEANGILPPLDASVGGYDLAAIGNPKIII